MGEGAERERIEVTDDAGRRRFVARVAGEVAGFVAYRRDEDVVTLTHTEVDDAFEGQGVGGALVRGTLDHLRETGRTVVPVCPFVRRWIDRHPDYADLVDGDA